VSNKLHKKTTMDKSTGEHIRGIGRDSLSTLCEVVMSFLFITLYYIGDTAHKQAT